MKGGIFSKIISQLRDKSVFSSTFITFIGSFLSVLYFEILLHFVSFGTPQTNLLFMILFSFAFSCVLAVILAAVPVRFRLGSILIIDLLLAIFYGSQMVYYFVFGSLYSVAQVQMGGAAVTSFWQETLDTILDHLPWVLALFIPMIVTLIVNKRRRSNSTTINISWCICLLCIGMLVHCLAIRCLHIGGTGYFTNYYYYYGDSTTTDQATQRFGLLTAMRLSIFGTETQLQDPADDTQNTIPETSVTPTLVQESTVPQETFVPETTVPETTVAETQPPAVIEYNVLEIDFDHLNTLTKNKKILELNNYCQTLTGTTKNEYTGMLKDYNLIVLCAESFSTAAIDPELTPTLYRLANEGFIFTNYYNAYLNNTTDGEYTLCMGLFPDFSRGQSAPSFYASRKSYLPFCLGNIFQEQRGISSYGYHNYSGSYYGRDESHPNMGYSMKFRKKGMTFTSAWPSSDLEMMEQSVDDYLTPDQQFHAYYMTFSGHMTYKRSKNSIADRNFDQVSHLEIGNAAKCYLACNIELDKALDYLMKKLEAAGVAEKTAIVLASDHFPYGLSDKQYAQIAGEPENEFSKYKSTLIFWVGGMDEPIVVDEYCCNVDILPTILNLWGFEYDSRLLAGTDILSDGTHVAVLRDMSFLTEKVWLNGSTGKITYLVEEEQLPEGYVDRMVQLVKSKVRMSKNILNTAYYNFIFDQRKVTVGKDEW